MSDDTNVKSLTEKDVKKFMKDFKHEFKPLVSKLTGENIPISFNDNDFQNIKNFMELGNFYKQKEDLINNATISEQEKLQKRMDLADDILKTVFDFNTDNPALELAQIANPKNSYEKIIPDIDYRILIRGTIHKFLYTVDKMGKLEQINHFISSMRPEDVFAMSQSAIRFNAVTQFVLKTRKRITKETVEQYVEDYREISGFLEPLIVLLYGIQQIILDKYKPFTEIKGKIPIGNLVKQLKSDKMFNPLMEKYDPHIRNSIMHVSYHIDPINKKIEFSDNGKMFSLTYFAFVEYVKEIARMAIITCHFEEEVRFLQLLGYVEKSRGILNWSIEY